MYAKYVIVQENFFLETAGAGTRIEQTYTDENGRNPKLYHGKILRIDEDETIHVEFDNGDIEQSGGPGHEPDYDDLIVHTKTVPVKIKLSYKSLMDHFDV